jgi:hypothetical protein
MASGLRFAQSLPLVGINSHFPRASYTTAFSSLNASFLDRQMHHKGSECESDAALFV